MSKYVYPAIFTQEYDGKYSVLFPDIENCFTGGDNMADALEMAEDVLCLTIYDMEKDGKPIPAPSDYKAIETDDVSVVSLIRCDTEFYRRYYENKSIKKTLSIPMWLNERAERKNVNFSGILQEALKVHLHIHE
ncbi:MAG: type II toxin-antitoxin system HicB family antitoxin [Oscillospiraceae bacterium]|nr:type II toxin-antitoxin system HicB family antitoxin [Oscillospiraceae bacterium]